MNTEHERAELLPCPFCGEGKDLIVQHCEGTIIHPAYRIYCGNCGASNGYSDRVDPVKNWNHRAALQSQDRECEIDMEIVAEQLRDMSSSAYETAMAFGISQDSFERLAHQVFDHARRIEENK